MLKQKLSSFAEMIAPRRKIIFFASILCIVTAGCAVFFNIYVQAQSANGADASQNSYMEETVVRSDIVVGVTEMGSSTLLSTSVTVPFDTTVSEVLIKPGEFVLAGDIIATIDPQAFDDLYDEAKIALEQAQLKLQESQLTASNQNLTAEQNYDKNIATGNSAETVYNLAVAELESGYNTILSEITSLETQLVTNAQQITAFQTNINNATADAQAKILQALNDYATNATITPTPTEAELKTLYDNILDKDNPTADEQKIIDAYNNITLINTDKQNIINNANTEIAKYQASTTQTNADLAKKYTERDNYAASMELKRVELLSTYETSIQNYNNAGAEYSNTVNTLSNSVDTAQATVDELQLELDMLTAMATDGSVISPIDGYVMTVVSDDDELKADDVIANIADSNMVYVGVSIPQEDIADIEIGMPVNIIFDAYDDFVIPSEVDSISITPSAGMQSSVNYAVMMICYMSAFEDIVIYQGMTADVTFVEKQVIDALVISKKCLIIEDGKQYVQRLTESGDIEKIVVETGFSDGFDVEIISGLSEGDTVIIESAVTQNAS